MIDRIPEKHLIIMTATVIPQVKQGLIRNKPELRLHDYLDSIENIEKQIRNYDIEILVVENSNSLDLIVAGLFDRKIDVSSIKFLASPIDKRSPSQGISSGEHDMLREVEGIFDLANYDVIWKLTGRLGLDNLCSILSLSSGDFRANSFFGQHHSVDSRFFGMSREVFIKFAKSQPNYSDSGSDSPGKLFGSQFRSIEYFLAYFALKIETEGLVYKSLPFLPLYRGVSGSTGKALDSIRTRTITILLNRVRKILIKGLLGVNP
jgi:hypothetical protein